MGTWRKVMQVVVSIAYTAVCSGVFFAAFYFLAKWMITLQPWLMILLLVVMLVLSIVRGWLLLMIVLLMAPYRRLLEDNNVSLYISTNMFSILMFLLIGAIWNLDYSGWGFAVVIVFTILILLLTFVSLKAMFKYSNDEYLFE